WALVKQGQSRAGLAELERGMNTLPVTGHGLTRPYALTHLADACVTSGEAQKGLLVIAEGLRTVEQTGVRFFEPEFHRLKGELLRQQAGPSRVRRAGPQAREAEACFRHALEVARRQQAKVFELRAAVSLGRVWQQDKPADAHRVLTDVY